MDLFHPEKQVMEGFTIQDIMQGIPGGFFIYRADGEEEILYANEATLHLFRCDTQQEFKALTGNSFKGIVHPDDLDRVEKYIAHQINGEFNDLDYVEYRIRRKDGEICWVEDFGRLVHDAEKGDLFYVFISDITARIERRNREHVIHQELLAAANSREREYMEMIQALSTDYSNVYRVNLTKDTVRALRMSNAIVQNFGNRFSEGSYQDLIRFYVGQSVYEPDREMLLAYAAPQHLRQVLQKENTCAVNYRVMRNGEIEYFRMSVSRIENAGADLEIAIGFSNVDQEIRHEMEQRKLVEHALAQAQHANSAKTTFLSNMSHDMRTPMNAIMGFSAIAAGHIDNTERVKDCLEKIMSSSAHLLSLINDILDMSRIESGKVQIQPKPCSLSELLHTLLNIIQPQVKAKQLHFSIDTYDVVDEDIYADPLKLNQIFINILGNAVKFTGAGGAVALQVCQTPGAAQGYGRYTFTVQDTGIGMSKEFVEHIFEPFERENTTVQSGIEGTGLGMAITKNIVEMMGGTIRVDSEKGKGTRFVVTLDLKLQEQSDTAQPIAELKETRALVVSGEEQAGSRIAGMLARLGLCAEWTPTPQEAARRVGAACREQAHYRTCLMDLTAVERADMEAVRQICAAAGERAPAMILAAYDWSELENQAMEAGAAVLCGKPVLLSDVKSALLKAHGLWQEPAAEAGADELDFSGKRVLLVEDNELNREIATEILQEAGFAVEVAVDGSDAVNMVQRSAEYYYDLILTDIQMPVMDGYEEVMAIRSMKRRDIATMPIIAMTANAFEEDKALALKCGMNGHLAKPLDISAVFKTLQEHLK